MTEFPLSKKWKNLVHKWANESRIPFRDCFQEALILEWELAQKKIAFKKKDTYFTSSLKRRIFSQHKRKTGDYFWKTKTVSLHSFVDDTVLEDSLFSHLVNMRSFDELYYEELITHVSKMLMSMDDVAYKLFLFRLENEVVCWDTIRKEHNELFGTISKSTFWRKVQLVKETVHQEILNAMHPNSGIALQS